VNDPLGERHRRRRRREGARPQLGDNLISSVPRSATDDRAELMQAMQEVLNRLTKA
jgi:hypothetical protein